MKIDLQGISERSQWEERGYSLPAYNVAQMAAATKENPFWVHFGAGNLFRAYHAVIAQSLLNSGKLDRGIVAVEGFDYEIIEKMYAPHDNLGISVTLKADGTICRKVVGSIAEALPLDAENKRAFERLKKVFGKDSLQLATFTITEKGYSLINGTGELLPEAAADFAAGPERPASYMGKVAALLYARYCAGKKPVAMVSTDNCSHNGDKLHAAVLAFAKAWSENGKAEKGFLEYIDSGKVSFPWSMIDKITPRPDASVEKLLRGDGVEGLEAVVTAKNTYAAPFVNAEEAEYLVIEDDFPNGRPPLEEGGILFTDRETVDKVEKMKVCTCLNPLHTALAIYGCLLGYKKISDEMKDEDLRKLVEIIGYREGLPAAVNPEILNPKEFLDTVLNVRIPNPFMPDTPQRIATDTSQKLAIRFGETIKAYQASAELEMADLKMIPFVFAGWLRYLMGIDDMGEKFSLSPDPLLDALCPYMTGVKLGEHVETEALRPILSDEKIFGVNLYDADLADTVTGYLNEMLAGPGAVRAALKKYVQ